MATPPSLLRSRSENELRLARILLRLSGDEALQRPYELLFDTYYSAVISHAYYAMFYAAKAYLSLRGVATGPPQEHRQVYDAFERLVREGHLDVELLRLYRVALERADTLLRLLGLERAKRGRYTYKEHAQANREPAAESVANAQRFLQQLLPLLEA